MRTFKSFEWPTMALAIVIYGGWLAITYFHSQLPSALVMVAGAWLVAWHSSLQHECLHGHPTRWHGMNTVIAFLPLSLWLPYGLYRTSHFAHHRAEILTDPSQDPESHYWTQDAWRKLWPVGRYLVASQRTLIGRLLLGPAWNAGRLLARDFTANRSHSRQRLFIWGTHFLGCAAILIWLGCVCKMSFWFYFFCIVYPGTSLSFLRSFVEHRASPIAEERTAIVENANIFGLLFLFNNLHVVHHRSPELAWYKIPAVYREHRDTMIAAKGTRVYNGYAEIVQRFLFASFDDPVHPLTS